MRLGIDFGTTRTVVSAVREGRYPVASFQTIEGFKEYLPGLASLTDGHLQLGAEVEPLPGVPLVRSVKATITGAAPDETISALPGTRYSALELATRYLVHVRQMLIDHSNLDIDPGESLEAMVAVPAHASTRQRYLTLEAFARAGFSVLGLVNEPTAGAIEFARHTLGALSPRSQKRYVVVYDLGGGTFDTAAVSLVDRHFDLLGAEGIPRLGGNNFDEIIAQLVLEQLGKDTSDVSELMMAHLLERCRMGKESLNPASRRLLVDVAELFTVDQVVIDAAELYSRARPLIEQTEAAVDILIRALVQHGIDPENPREMGAVYLVGGSVQFPAVQRMLRARFGRKVQLAPQPHASTAIGLAIAADPDADIYVREVPTRHFGVWREGDLGREKVFDPIIEKRLGEAQAGPVRVERVYRPAHAVGRLRFVECTSLDESGQPQGEVTPWETILFPYDPALADRSDLEPFCGGRGPSELQEEIAEVYEYTPSGLVRISIENRTRGYRREYVLGSSAHL